MTNTINLEQNRNIYIDSLKMLFKQNNIEIYDNLGGCALINDKLILFATKEKNLKNILNLLKKNSISELKTINLKMLKSIFFKNSSGIKALIISANKKYLSPESNNMNVASEICSGFQNAGKKNKIDILQYLDESSFINLLGAFDTSITQNLGLDVDEYNLYKCKNSQREHIKYYMKCKNNPKRLFMLSKKYNHIDTFSNIYFAIIKVISENLNDKSKSICIHDIGANVSQFPLMLASLSSEDLLGININKIIASDLVWMDEISVNKILQENKKYLPINFIKLDITDSNQNIPASDVTILIDVLEHLKNEDIAFNALKRVWENTKDLLLVHIPFEKEPNPLWGHFVAFNQDKIKNWASKFNDGIFLSDNYKIGKTETLTDKGFLILKKKK